MATYHEFDEKAVAAALEAARQHHDEARLAEAASRVDALEDGHLAISGGCISVTVEGGRICVNLPLGIGKVCLPIPPVFPDGTAAQACLKICTNWGIPTGVKVTVSVAGVVVVEKSFGKC